MPNNINDYQIFVASSLREGLQPYRQRVAQVADEVSRMPAMRMTGFRFSDFRYENKKRVYQEVASEGVAQDAADAELRRSPLFVLVIYGPVGEMSRHEFALAIRRLRQRVMPFHVYVFCHNDEESLAEWANLKQANLPDERRLDVDGVWREFEKDYYKPFDSVDDFDRMLREELEGLLVNRDLPPVGAKLGSQLDKVDFFIERKESSPDCYFDREFDTRLSTVLTDGAAVWLYGDSLCGKTRAAMVAMQRVEDGWVYVLREPVGDERSKEVQLEQLTDFVRREHRPKLYIMIDDVDKFSDKLKPAVVNLVRQVNDRGGAVLLMTAHVPSEKSDLPLAEARVEDVPVGKMGDKEVKKALEYFSMVGYNVDDRNTAYRMIGAWFVDLGNVRSEYNRYLTGGDGVADFERDMRRMLLKALKAQWIWRDEQFGNLRLLKSMACHFFKSKWKYRDESDEKVSDVFEDALGKLCSNVLMGVYKEKERLRVEDYVCQYVLGYNADLLEDASDGPEVAAELLQEEKDLIRDTLSYCRQHMPEGETLTWQVARLMGRCDHKEEVRGWLYGLWRQAPEDEEGVLAELAAERERCEKDRLEGDIDRYNFVSFLYIYRRLTTPEEAWVAYQAVPEGMRNASLLAAAISKADSEEARARLFKLPEYERFKTAPEVVRNEMRWASDYDAAERLLGRYEVSGDAAHILLSDPNPFHPLRLFRQAMMGLSVKIGSEQDFNKWLQLLRNHFDVVTTDETLLREYSEGLETGEPQVVDIICAAGWSPVFVAMKNISAGMTAAEAVDMFSRRVAGLVGEVKSEWTKATPARRQTIRNELSSLCGSLIREAARKSVEAAEKNIAGVDYDTVYGKLFAPLKFEVDGETVILRNTYTYTSLMRCEGCDSMQCMNLLKNELEPHTLDRDNPLVVNRYTLNLMLAAAVKQEKPLYYQNVDRLYDRLNIGRDEFAYHLLLERAESKRVLLRLLKVLGAGRVEGGNGSKVKHNLFTLLALQRNRNTGVREAFYILGLPPEARMSGYTLKKPQGVDWEDEYVDGLRKMLADMPEAWRNLFRKPMETDADREAVGYAMEWMERNKMEAFERNKEDFSPNTLYNPLMENTTFLRTIEEIVAFADEKEVYDEASLLAIAKRIERLKKGNLRWEANEVLNRQIEKCPKAFGVRILSYRLRLYTSHDEKMKMVFVDGEGHVSSGEYSPIEYVERMSELGYNIVSYTINSLLDENKNGVTDDIRRRLLAMVKGQVEKGYRLNTGDITALRDRCWKYIDAHPDEDPGLPPRTAFEQSKYWQYRFSDSEKRRENGVQEGLVELEKALDNLDWSDAYAALVGFNAIVYTYSKRKKTAEDFEKMRDLYQKHLVQRGIQPDGLTFSSLADMATMKEQFEWLLEEHKRARIEPMPHFLGRVVAARDVMLEDIVWFDKQCKAMGTRTDGKTVDTYVYKMTAFICKRDSKVDEMMTNLFDYIMLGKGGELLSEGDYKSLGFDRYLDKDNISAELLKSLLLFNYTYRRNRYTLDMLQKLLEGVDEKRRRELARLLRMEKKEEDGTLYYYARQGLGMLGRLGSR